MHLKGENFVSERSTKTHMDKISTATEAYIALNMHGRTVEYFGLIRTYVIKSYHVSQSIQEWIK